MIKSAIPAYAYLCLVGSMALVGANVAVGKLIIMEIPVLVFSGIRFAVACAVIAPFAFFGNGGETRRLTQRNWLDLFLQSFFGVFLFTLLMLYGVSMTSASSAGVITGAIPAAIAALAWLLLGERPTGRVLLGVVLAAVGIAVLNLGGGFQGDDDAGGASGSAAMGMLLIGGAVISEALFTIFAKRGSANVSPLRMVFYVNLIGLVLIAPLAIWSSFTFEPSTVSKSTWFLALYYALTGSVISFLLWYIGIKQVPATRAGVFTAVLPVVAVSASVLFLDEPIGISLMVGMVCVILAVILVTTAKNDTTKTAAIKPK